MEAAPAVVSLHARRVRRRIDGLPASVCPISTALASVMAVSSIDNSRSWFVASVRNSRDKPAHPIPVSLRLNICAAGEKHDLVIEYA